MTSIYVKQNNKQILVLDTRISSC